MPTALAYRAYVTWPVLPILFITASAAPVAGQDIPLTPLVQTVKQALLMLDGDAEGGIAFVIGDTPYTFDSAELTVQLVNTGSFETGVDFKVVSLEAGGETQATQAIDLTLRLPDTGDDIRQSSEARKAARQLVDLLRTSTAELTAPLRTDPELIASNVTVSSKFAVTYVAGVGIQFKLFGLGGGSDAEMTDSNAQRIALNFLPQTASRTD